MMRIKYNTGDGSRTRKQLSQQNLKLSSVPFEYSGVNILKYFLISLSFYNIINNCSIHI